MFGWKALPVLLGGVLTMLPAGESSPDSYHFPIVGETDYADVHHDYPATDIFADCGEKVVSPVAGTVLEVGRVDRWDPASNRGAQRGGLHVSIRGSDGVRYYGSHLSRVRPEIERGAVVQPGQHIGRVGRTGSARYTPCHLHFGLSPVCPSAAQGAGQDVGQWWLRRGVVPPYRFLRSWQAGGDLSPESAVSTWQNRHGCPVRPD